MSPPVAGRGLPELPPKAGLGINRTGSVIGTYRPKLFEHFQKLIFPKCHRNRYGNCGTKKSLDYRKYHLGSHWTKFDKKLIFNLN